ncbi:MAG: hypothetical protein JWO05_3931 [Gemmatimonadetes bacterium]|nr:hypothetical protein [Gemmatimonadota bacterium]
MTRGEQRAWAARVTTQLAYVTPEGAELMLFAGVLYRRDLMQFFAERNCRVCVPLKGLRLGEQLHALVQLKRSNAF